MESNQYTHISECPFKNLSIPFSSCGFCKVWEKVEDLEAKVKHYELMKPAQKEGN